MDIKFYYNASDNRCVKKVLMNELVISGVLRDSSSIIKPDIQIVQQLPVKFNYCYIPDFSRYYFITGIDSVRNGLWAIHMEVDPLMSFKGDILALRVVVDKQSDKVHGDEYIDDSSLVADNLLFNTVYNFPNGFNDTGEYILITAG